MSRLVDLIDLIVQVNDTSEVIGDPEHTQEGNFDGEKLSHTTSF